MLKDGLLLSKGRGSWSVRVIPQKKKKKNRTELQLIEKIHSKNQNIKPHLLEKLTI